MVVRAGHQRLYACEPSVGMRGSACHAGGCQLSLHGDKLYLYSGHTVVVDKEDRTESDVVHDDLWALDLNTFAVCMPFAHSIPSLHPQALLHPVACRQCKMKVRMLERQP